MEQGLVTLYETAMFSEKQVVTLTGLSRKRLYNLSVSGIVVPEKDPILYTWKQVVFLRVLYLLREDWSLQVIDKQFRVAAENGIDRLIELIDTSIAVLFFESSDQYEFSTLEISIFKEEFYDQHLVKALNKIKEGTTLDYNDIFALISEILQQPSKTDGSKISFNKQTLIIIPELIRELTQAASGLNIEFFNLEAG